MAAMTRGVGTALVVGLLALVGAAGCGDSETPRATRTTTVIPSPTATPSPAPESVLGGPTVVAARQLSDGSRVLIAYDLGDGTTKQLTTLQREDHPTVDATGTSVVVQQYTGTAETDPWGKPGTGSHLVLIDLATGARGALTAATRGVLDQAPVWNRTGDGWVYFVRTVDAGTASAMSTLWRVDPSTGDVQRAPQAADVPVSRFVVERDGQIAWVQAGWCDKDCGGAWRLDLTTGGHTRHQFDPVSGGDWAWTPDGTRLAYSAHEGGVPGGASLVITGWPDGTPRTLMSTKPEEVGGTTTWHAFLQVGWEPDGSAVIVQDTQYSWDSPGDLDSVQVEQRILLVDTADGSTTPIGPASVHDLSFDVWAPPATS
jgi:hypothetical protein